MKNVDLRGDALSWKTLKGGKKQGYVKYRKCEAFEMQWGPTMDLDQNVVSCAPCGGPIAMIRDENKIIALRDYDQAEPHLNIYTGSGMLVSSNKWPPDEVVGGKSNADIAKIGSVVHLGWTAQEKLICVTNNAYVFVYDFHGHLENHFSMLNNGGFGAESGGPGRKVIEAITWNEG